MHHSEFVQTIIDKLKAINGLQAIVLGGSWASGTQRPDSDIDLGLYYAEDYPLDIAHVRRIASELHDVPNPIVTDLGEWGRWVNGGAWLTTQGQRVDFLYRNIHFVASIIDDCNRGAIQTDYWQQPPYGFYSYMYCAETHICKILYDPHAIIHTLKAKVASYPQPLKHTIINEFAWSAEFTLAQAKKLTEQGNIYFVAGCLTRVAICLVQVLYALNETYFISDKRLHKDVEKFNRKPQDFSVRIDTMLGTIGSNREQLHESLLVAEALLEEVIVLCGDEYKPRF